MFETRYQYVAKQQRFEDWFSAPSDQRLRCQEQHLARSGACPQTPGSLQPFKVSRIVQGAVRDVFDVVKRVVAEILKADDKGAGGT